jgi:thiosulfate reductase cytochrome b subunit
MSEPHDESDEVSKEQEEKDSSGSESAPELSTVQLPLELPVSTPPPSPLVRWVYRHTFIVRLSHWINVLCLPILIMSGFQIFNAHPALYLGDRSDRDRPIFSMKAVMTEDGEMKGITTFFGHAFETTGFLGVSKDSFGGIRRRGFPSWATLPSGKWLAMGRRWHLFFAWVFVLNGLLFGLYSLLSRHLLRDLFPRWRDLRGVGRAVLDHLLFRHPTGEEPAHYNVLQKIAYTGVVFGLGPLIVLTGLTMSPQMDAAFPWLLTLFGGRQSARTIHFVACFAFIGYTLIHLFMVAMTGFWNNLRSMLSGRYRMTEFGGANDEQRGG